MRILATLGRLAFVACFVIGAPGDASSQRNSHVDIPYSVPHEFSPSLPQTVPNLDLSPLAPSIDWSIDPQPIQPDPTLKLNTSGQKFIYNGLKPTQRK